MWEGIFYFWTVVVEEHWLHNAKTGERKECVGSGSILELLSYPPIELYNGIAHYSNRQLSCLVLYTEVVRIIL